jgi:glycosyltransferase involved in cell wall biosynthesis
VTSAVPDIADPVGEIGDLAASAGLRRIHVLAWRDLDDVDAGGSEVHIDEVASRWAKAGLDITMCTKTATGHEDVPDTVRHDYRVVRRGNEYTVFPRAAVGEIARRTGPRDVLVEIWNGMPFLSPLWNPGPRVVLLHHLHAEMWHMQLGRTLGSIGAAFERRIAPRFYRRTPIATLSESSRDELVRDMGFDEHQVTVVHPGIDRRFTPGGERSREPLVVACGRLARVKRYDALIRAAHHARARVPNLQLHIVGQGEEQTRVIEPLIAELGAADWVTLRGRLADGELVDLYRSAWLVASASAREGWGMTLTEAAACGTPAVATRIAGHSDAVREGWSGILTEHDPASLGDALADVLADEGLRSRLSKGALAWASELTWDNTAVQLMRIVAREVSQHRSRR